MSKRVLAILVAALLAIGIFGAVAKAGVDGSFKFDIWMWPQTTAVETSKFDIDFEAYLVLNITFSGLTIGNRVVMGIAGLEHYILGLDTTLGALDVFDQFVFATPYIGCPRRAPAKFWDIDFFVAYGPFTTCKPVGDLLFVKKRVNLEMTIGGLTLSGLIMFEDLNFPSPTATTFTDTNGNGIYDAVDQAFGFGGIVGFSGQTVSGIKITAKTGICADWTIFLGFYTIGKYGGWGFIPDWAPNDIKKYRWYESVVYPCSIKEYIAIENFSPISNLKLNNYLIMIPYPYQFISYTEAVYTLPMELGTLYSWFQWPGGLTLGGPTMNVFYLSLANLEILWYDLGGDFSMTADDELTAAISLDIQNASFLVQGLFIPTIGVDRFLVEADLPISYPEPIGTLEITALWAAGTKEVCTLYCTKAGVDDDKDGSTDEELCDGTDDDGDGRIDEDISGGCCCKPTKISDGRPAFNAVDFKLIKSFGEHNTFAIDAQFGAKGLRAVEFTIGVTFSL